MAGTGHSYEIGNIARVRAVSDALAANASGRDLALAADWFRRRPFLKFATSEAFVRKARAGDVPFEHAEDAEREILASKFHSGSDVRMFSEVFFERVGPDFGHVLDWLYELRRNRPQEYAKLSRMAPEAVVAAAASWIPQPKGRTSLPPGRTTEVLGLEDGFSWVELVDEAALEHEGSFMAHCVGRGSYHPILAARRARFFSLRDGAGRSHVTTSVWCEGQRLSFDQAKGYWNAAPHRSCLPALAALLNHLDIRPSGGREERYAQILYREGVGWSSIYQAWRKRTLFGLEILHDDVEALFMSPSRPDTVMCTLVAAAGLSGLWNGSEDEIHDAAFNGLHVFDIVALPENERLRPDELRAAAELLTKLHVPSACLKQHVRAAAFEEQHWESRLVFSGWRWHPWVETLERRSTAHGSYLVDPATHVALVGRGEGQTVPLMWIGPRSLLGPAEGAGTHEPGPAILPVQVERWSAADALRCLAVMSDLQVERIPYETRRDHPVREFDRRYRPMRLESGEWRSFSIDREVVKERSRPVTWEVTPYAVTMRHDADVALDLRLHDRKVTELPYGLHLREPAARCLAAYLNRRRIGLADHASVPRLIERLPERKHADRPYTVWNGRKWCVARSAAEVSRYFADVGQLTKAQAEILLRLLPKDPMPGSAGFDLYVRAVFALLGGWNAKSGPAAPLADQIGQHALTMALRHQEMASGAQWRVLVKFLTKAIDEWSRLSKHVLGAGWLNGAGKTREAIFLDACRHVPAGCRDRFVAAFFRKGRHRLCDGDEAVRWVEEVYPLLKDDKARSALISGVSMSTFPDRRQKDVARLRNTLRLIRFEAEIGTCSLVDFHLDQVRETLDALAADPEARSAEMIELARAEMAEIRLIPEQRKERARARWDLAYRRVSDPSARSAAAEAA